MRGLEIARLGKFGQATEIFTAKIIAVLGSSGAYSYTIQLGYFDMRTGAATGGTWVAKPSTQFYTAFADNLTATTPLTAGTYCEVKVRGRDTSGNKYFSITGSGGGASTGTQLLYSKSVGTDTLAASGTFASQTVSLTPYMTAGTVLRFAASLFFSVPSGEPLALKTAAGTSLIWGGIFSNISWPATDPTYVDILYELTWTTSPTVANSRCVVTVAKSSGGYQDVAQRTFPGQYNYGANPGGLQISMSLGGGGSASLIFMSLEKLA